MPEKPDDTQIAVEQLRQITGTLIRSQAIAEDDAEEFPPEFLKALEEEKARQSRCKPAGE